MAPLTKPQRKILESLAQSRAVVPYGRAHPVGMNGNALRKLVDMGFVAYYRPSIAKSEVGVSSGWYYEITEEGRAVLKEV